MTLYFYLRIDLGGGILHRSHLFKAKFFFLLTSWLNTLDLSFKPLRGPVPKGG